MQAINEYFEVNKHGIMSMDGGDSSSSSEDEGDFAESMNRGYANVKATNIMFDDQAEDVDDQFLVSQTSTDNPDTPTRKFKYMHVEEDINGENYEPEIEDRNGIPHVSINLQKTPSPSQYKKRSIFPQTQTVIQQQQPHFDRESGTISSTKNPMYIVPKASGTPPSAKKQQMVDNTQQYKSILKGESNDDEDSRSPSGIPLPSSIPSKKNSPKVKFEGASIVEVPATNSTENLSLEEFQKRYIERASSPPPFSVINEEKLAKLEDVERLLSGLVLGVAEKKTEEIKLFSEFLHNGILQLMETQFNTMLNLRTNISFEDSPEYKQMIDRIEFLNDENEQLKSMLEEKDLEIETLKEQAEIMRDRYILDIDKLTSEVANQRIAPKSQQPQQEEMQEEEQYEEEQEEDMQESPRRTQVPRRTKTPSPPPSNPQPSSQQMMRRSSTDFNAAVKSALHNMSKDQTINPLTRSMDAKQIQSHQQESSEPEEKEVVEPTASSSTETQKKKINKTVDSLTERMLRSLKGPTKIEDNAKEIDKQVADVKDQFKEKNVILPLKRVKDCVYLLGEGKAARKLHLALINGALKVKIGGGYDDFLKFLSQSLRLLQVKK